MRLGINHEGRNGIAPTFAVLPFWLIFSIMGRPQVVFCSIEGDDVVYTYIYTAVSTLASRSDDKMHCPNLGYIQLPSSPVSTPSSYPICGTPQPAEQGIIFDLPAHHSSVSHSHEGFLCAYQDECSHWGRFWCRQRCQVRRC